MIFIPDQKTGFYYRNDLSLIVKLKWLLTLMFHHKTISQYSIKSIRNKNDYSDSWRFPGNKTRLRNKV